MKVVETCPTCGHVRDDPDFGQYALGSRVMCICPDRFHTHAALSTTEGKG